jgi:hypothetical protein
VYWLKGKVFQKMSAGKCPRGLSRLGPTSLAKVFAKVIISNSNYNRKNQFLLKFPTPTPYIELKIPQSSENNKPTILIPSSETVHHSATTNQNINNHNYIIFPPFNKTPT